MKLTRHLWMRLRRRPGLRALGAISCCMIGWYVERDAAAAIKVACVGGSTTHSDAYQEMNRETQPPGMQEYPAQLQTMLGSAFEVRNFGDCCASVLQGYKPTETHPYVNGPLAGKGPGYPDSITFMPDIVIIGSWGRHDWGMKRAPTEVWDLTKFQADYDDLVQRYLNLPNHPLVYVTLPMPIPFGETTQAPGEAIATSGTLPAFHAVADKYHLPVIDLYSAYVNHKEYFIQTGSEAEGEHPTNMGLTVIAQTVYKAMMAYMDGGAGSGSSADASVDDGGDAGEVAEASPGVSSGATAGTEDASSASSGATSSSGSSSATTGASSSGDQASSGGGGSGSSAAASSGGSVAATTPSESSGGCAAASGRSTGRWAFFAPLAAIALLARRRRSR